MYPPHVDVPWSRQALDAQREIQLRRAIGVPTSKLTHLARPALVEEAAARRSSSSG